MSETGTSYKERRAHEVAMLEGVIDGKQVGHVWTSRLPKFDGADMVIRFAAPDIEVGEGDHGLPEEFATDVQLEYAGEMTPERAAEKLASFRVAAHAVAAGGAE